MQAASRRWTYSRAPNALLTCLKWPSNTGWGGGGAVRTHHIPFFSNRFATCHICIHTAKQIYMYVVMLYSYTAGSGTVPGTWRTFWGFQMDGRDRIRV